MTEKEYNICVDLYSDKVFRFIMKTVRDKDEAMNIVQNTYEKLWIHREKVNYETSRAWLFTTSYRLMIDEIKRNKRFISIDEVHEDQFHYQPGHMNIKELLDKAFDRLPEIQKSVVLLRDYEGYSYEEIAEITNLSLAQVKVYIFRARTFLKNYIGKPEVIL